MRIRHFENGEIIRFSVTKTFTFEEDKFFLIKSISSKILENDKPFIATLLQKTASRQFVLFPRYLKITRNSKFYLNFVTENY